MSYLQRSPIDVDAAAGGHVPADLLEEATARLLYASTGLFPYAGAIVRNCVSGTELEELNSNQLSLGFTNIEAVQPVHRATQEWWDTRPYKTDCDVTGLQLTGVLETPGMGSHIDQNFGQQDLPKFGPVTALLVLEGFVSYTFSVYRKNAFNPKHIEPIIEKARELRETRDFDSSSGRLAKVTARTGDMVLFTNTPPTIHSAKATGDRKTLRFETSFRSAKR